MPEFPKPAGSLNNNANSYLTGTAKFHYTVKSPEPG
jgi:hypothetical protein